MDEILEAIARARVADKRLQLARSLADEPGVLIAYQAFLYNLVVIREAIAALPADLRETQPATPWNRISMLPDELGGAYLRVDAERIHRTAEQDLVPLDLSVRRLRATVPPER